MVQFINTKSRSGYLADALGPALGQGLGEFAGSYFANKALDSVINDPSLKEAPVSERLSRLQSAMSPYGERGQRMFQTRLGLEQQKLQEQQQAKSQQVQGVLAKLLRGEQLSPQEESILPTDVQIDAKKAMTPKAPPGGLSGQPVPPEVSQRIPQILNENREASADQLAQAFDREGIPRAYSNSYIENRRQKDKPTFEPTEEKLEAERVSKFADEIIKDYQASESSEPRLKQMVALADSKKLATPLMVKTLNTLGIPLSVLTNPETEQYQKLENDFVKDVSNYFPGQVRVYEAQTYMKTIPSLLNSDEGKRIVARNLQIQNEAKKLRFDEYKKILKENNGRKPRNLDIEIIDRTAPKIAALGEEMVNNMNQAVEQYGPKITMYDDQGQRYEIPMNQLEAAMNDGLKTR